MRVRACAGVVGCAGMRTHKHSRVEREWGLKALNTTAHSPLTVQQSLKKHLEVYWQGERERDKVRGWKRETVKERERISTHPTFSRSAQTPRAKLAVLLLFFFSLSLFFFLLSFSLSRAPRGKVELQQDSAVPTETGETVLPWQRGIACSSGELLHLSVSYSLRLSSLGTFLLWWIFLSLFRCPFFLSTHVSPLIFLLSIHPPHQEYNQSAAACQTATIKQLRQQHFSPREGQTHTSHISPHTFAEWLKRGKHLDGIAELNYTLSNNSVVRGRGASKGWSAQEMLFLRLFHSAKNWILSESLDALNCQFEFLTENRDKK